MDVESMFSDFADFTEMVEASSNKLSVGKIIQKAFIEINEEGSEAAAASIHGRLIKFSLDLIFKISF